MKNIRDWLTGTPRVLKIVREMVKLETREAQGDQKAAAEIATKLAELRALPGAPEEVTALTDQALRIAALMIGREQTLEKY